MPDTPTPDRSAPAEPPGPNPDTAAPLPAFTPVPRRKPRRDGWTPAIQRAFIEALADTGSVRSACRRVGRSEVGAYQLRRQPEAGEFRAAWHAALDLGVQKVEDVVMDRALNGVEVPVWSYGKPVGTRIAYNDRLLMFILRNRAPERFAEGRARGLSALDRQTLARLEREWRAQWEREQAEAEAEAEGGSGAGFDGPAFIAQLEQMHRRWYGALSPRARAAYRQFRRIERDDREAGYQPYEDETAEALAEYDEGAAALNGRAKVNLLIEADGFGVDEILAEEEAPQSEPEPTPRIRTLKGEWE